MVERSQAPFPPSSQRTTPRWFHLLAGPNGAGKSTLYRALVREGILGPPLEFVNADLYEQAHLQHMTNPEARSEAARQWADNRRATLLHEGADFASETVFSHPSKLALIEEAQRCGYTVALYIVALDDPSRLLSRVAQRVREGGHPVPPQRILARYPRTMDNLALAVRLANVSYLYDAAEATGTGPQLVAVYTPHATTALAPRLPNWAQQLAGS